jgi:hypothetical protein
MGAISKMFSGKAAREAKASSEKAALESKRERQASQAMQQQEVQASAQEVEKSLGKARSRPRGRRLLLGDQTSTLA